MSRVAQLILEAELNPANGLGVLVDRVLESGMTRCRFIHDYGVHDRVRHREPIAIPPVVAQQQAKNRVKRKRPRKKSDPDPAAPKIIIGVDSEWVEPFASSVYPEHETGRNLMLSAQFLMLYQGQEFTPRLYYTQPARRLRDDLGDPDDAGRRWPLRDGLYEYIRDAVEAGFLAEWPESVYLAGHWTRADLPGFADYGRIRKKLDGVRKTYVSLGKPLSIGRKEGGRWHGSKVWLIDTFLLAPGNSRGLDKVAKLYGLEKMPLPAGAIQRMDLLLRDDQAKFEEYAIQDARIAAHHAAAVAEFAEQESGPGKIPVTLSALGVNVLLARWQDRGINRLYLTGQMQRKIPGRRGRPEIVKIPGFERFETLAIDSYFGAATKRPNTGRPRSRRTTIPIASTT